MRSESIFFHPRSSPTVERVTTAAGDAILLEAGGMAFVFHNLEELQTWVDELGLAVSSARAGAAAASLVVGDILAQGARS